jgi:hypothetical protein
VKADSEFLRIDNRAQQAFNRHDDRKKEYEESMREISKIKDSCLQRHKAATT